MMGVHGSMEKVESKQKPILSALAEFDSVSCHLDKGIIKTHCKNHYGLLSIQGTELLPCEYDNIDIDFFDGVCIEKQDKFGWYTYSGEMLLPVACRDMIYEVGNCSNSIKARVDSRPVKRGICPANCTEIEILSRNFIKVKIHDRWGIIDGAGNTICEPRFDTIDDFEAGYAQILIGDKIGLMRCDGKIICEPKYDYVDSFCRGFAKVKCDGLYGLIDEDGIEALSCEFDVIGDLYGRTLSVIYKGELKRIPDLLM